MIFLHFWNSQQVDTEVLQMEDEERQREAEVWLMMDEVQRVVDQGLQMEDKLLWIRNVEVPQPEHAEVLQMEHAGVPQIEHAGVPQMEDAEMPQLEHAEVPQIEHAGVPQIEHAEVPQIEHDGVEVLQMEDEM